MRVVGFRVRSGVTLCVLLEGTKQSWQVLASGEVRLSPEDGKFARFPFHPTVELEGRAALAESRKAVAGVRMTARREMRAALADLAPIEAAGVVGGSLTDPERIHNPHMQAHAREAQLFREVVTAGLTEAGIAFKVLSDRDILARLADLHRTSVAALNRSLTRAGRGTFRPWAAHQKLAAAGALWALH